MVTCYVSLLRMYPVGLSMCCLVFVQPVLLIFGVALSVGSSPLCVLGLAGMFTDDQFATYDFSFCMAMSSPNIMQNAEIMSAFLFSDSSVADSVIWSSIYSVLCV